MAQDARAKYSYSTKRPLGSGAFADVFLGSCKQRRLKVAVKRILKAKMQYKPKVQRLLRNEVSLLRELDGHENVVRLYDCFEDRQYMHLVLEYCDAGDLAAYLKSHAPLVEPVLHDFLSQMSSGLQHVRAHNISHRDIKPQNVLLHSCANTPSGYRVKLTDFGFACRLMCDDMTKTFCGSPLHMAPEILAGGHYDPKIDLWSVGTIAYQMAMGTTPYRAKNIRDLKHKLREARQKQQPLPLPSNVSREFTDLVVRLLNVDPAARISFEGFFTHVFFQKPSRHSVYHDNVQPESMLMSTSQAVTPTSFVIVDKRATEFAQKLERLCSASEAALSDDVRQITLRDMATSSVERATLILFFAASHDMWERMLLLGYALKILRATASRAREHMESFGDTRPCQETIVVAQKFHKCMEYCLAQLDSLRKRASEEDGGSNRTPFELLHDVAVDLIQRAGRHEQRQERIFAKTLYKTGIALLIMIRDSSSGRQELERLNRFIESTERRLHIVSTDTFSQVGLATLANDSQQLGIASQASQMTTSRSSSCSQQPSHPIDIPGAAPARFCAACGLKFTFTENYCAMCGAQRSQIVGSHGSYTISQSLPSSWK